MVFLTQWFQITDRTNGQAERFVQTVKKSLLKSLEENPNADIESVLNKALHKMRICVSESTGKTPSELFLGRSVRTSLDLLRPSSSFNDRLNLTDPKFSVGSKVAVRNYVNGPKWKIGIIDAILGPLTYNVNVSGRVVKRHEKQMRVVNSDVPVDSDTCDNPNVFLFPDTSVTTLPSFLTSGSDPPRRSSRIPKPIARMNL